MSNDKAPEMTEVCLTKEDNDFYKSTSTSDNLQSCGNSDMNDALAWESDIGCSIEEPQKVVDWWFVNQLCKEIRPGAYKKLGKSVYNNFCRKKCMEVIFDVVKKLLMTCAMRT